MKKFMQNSPFGAKNSELFLRMGTGLLAGGTPREQMALASQGLLDARQSAKQAQTKNKTLQFLQNSNPELAQMVEMGALTPNEAVKLAYNERNKTSEFDEYGFKVGSSMSQKMKGLLAQGVDTQRALGIVTGRYGTSINPMTNERVRVDLATDEYIPLNERGASTETEAQAQQPALPRELTQRETLYDQAPYATGLGTTLRQGAANTIGQIPGEIGDAATHQKTLKAVQEFDLFKRDLIRSLSLNPRFPVAEQQRIEQLVPRGAFVSEDSLKQALRSLDAELQSLEAQAQAGLQDRTATVEQRQRDKQSIRDIRATRERLGVMYEKTPANPASGGAPASNDLSDDQLIEHYSR